MRGESWVKDWRIGKGDLSVVLGQKLTNVASIGVNCRGFDKDAGDGVPQGKVLGIKG
jgi:hypothetical protein